jgi:hypothetical protein
MEPVEIIAVALITISSPVIAAVIQFIAARSRQRKRISYSILADTPLPKELEENAEILSQGQPIQDTRLLVIQIRNTGNIAVHPKDYYIPITFVFGDRVISSSIKSTTPASSTNLRDHTAPPTITRPDEQSVALDKILLKPKEAIIMSVLVAGSTKHIKVKGRIVDGEISEQSNLALLA